MKPYNNDNRSKSEEVSQMFDNIAPTYDSLNHILSLSIDKRWRRNVVKIAGRCTPSAILDVATGTGDLALALSKKIPTASIVGVDPSRGMLAVAERKVAAAGLSDRITLRHDSAEQLHEPSQSYDVATVAFGVRNFGDLEGGLREMIRTLKPGGTLIILEFSRCTHPIFAPLYKIYSKWVMPTIGSLLSRDRKAYQYLPDSIEEFASPNELLAIMDRCGVSNSYNRPQFFGVAQIYVGVKQ